MLLYIETFGLTFNVRLLNDLSRIGTYSLTVVGSRSIIVEKSNVVRWNF